jgi:hypothetical protein
MAGRNQVRSSLVYILKVQDSRSSDLLGYLWDASTDGLNLIGEQPLQVGRTYDLIVAYPKGDREPVKITAETMWSNPDPESDFYRTGMRLIPGQEEAVHRLSEMVEEYRFVDPPDEWSADIGEA